jgi:hypothetical protein
VIAMGGRYRRLEVANLAAFEETSVHRTRTGCQRFRAHR